ncbi:MAG TPA: peptide-N4-asparagine amidase [Myxococcaceae bacterium]|nr:peptide-N4-asparagine amidase [Myxococcaceae bacterium]
MFRNSRVRGCGMLVGAIANSIFISFASAGQYAITADPAVPRPSTTPCAVQLFDGFRFDDFTPRTFQYAPPDQCPGPWAKVVLEGDFYVTAGRQFDRTANIWIGGACVYFGTTPEPSATISPTWHFERDLTDYFGLFTMPHDGRVDLGNLVDSTYTGIIYGSADLKFYPLADGEAAPVTADVVLPLSGSPTGGTVGLDTTDSMLERTFTLPTNIERAYLDVFAQSQATDEFWMLCVPDDVASVLRSCSGTGFRETEVAIDGQPAGVAPIYPWIFTGGIDPYLWRPIPGVQTFNFAPYRVNLTPFAGVLSDGQSHSVALSVYNANHHFSTTASLLLFLDPGATQVSGAVTLNTLDAGPMPDIQTRVSTMDGVTTGKVNIHSPRNFTIEGFVDTSHGRVQTRVQQSIDFASDQEFNITSTTFAQALKQRTNISLMTITNGVAQLAASQRFQWPLTLTFSASPRPGGITARTTIVRQAFGDVDALTQDGAPLSSGEISSVLNTKDTLLVMGSTIVGREDTASSHQYFSQDSSGGCYSRRIDSEGGVVTEIVDGETCTPMLDGVANDRR